jgi:putative transposase
MPKHGYDDVTCAKLDIADYIVGYHCQVRPHSFNDYLTPVEKEKQFFNQNLLEPV